MYNNLNKDIYETETDNLDSNLKSNSYYRLTREERETCLVFNETDGVWIADTSIPKDINAFTKANWKVLNKHEYPDGTIKAMVFEAPKNMITFRTISNKSKGSKPKRTLSPEHLAKMQAARPNKTKST